MIPELRENSDGKLEKWMQKEKFYVRLEDKLAEDEGYMMLYLAPFFNTS